MIAYLTNILNKNFQINGEKLPFTLIELILGLILPAAIVLSFYKALIIILKKSLKKSSISEEIKKRIIKYTKIFLRIIVLLSLLNLIDRILGAEISRYFGYTISVINTPFFSAGKTAVSIVTIIMMIPVFFIASWAGKLVYKILDTSLKDTTAIDETRKFTFANLAKYAVSVVAILIGLSIIGIDISSIAVMFGVLGIGLGFGLQNLIANLFAGIVIILTHPVKKGDLVTIENNRGYIVRINTISTVVDTLMNETIIVPNSLLISNVIFNDTYHDKSVVIANNVSVSYDSDVETVKELLIQTGKNNPYAVKDALPDARLLNFGASGIEMVVYTAIVDVADKGRAVSWGNFEIWRVFRENGIQIPYPQIDLHIKENK